MAFSTTTHWQYKEYAGIWEQNKDVANGLVKQKKEKYLPRKNLPKQALKSNENNQLQEFLNYKYDTQFWPMARFVDFTRTTISSWVGLIMSKKPVIQFTGGDGETILDYLLVNADGSGNGLETVARLGIEASVITGGGGYLVSMPSGTMTVQSIRDGSIAPMLKMYDRQNILDWEVAFIGGRKQLTYLKLREYEYYSNSDTSEKIEKHIEFFLNDGLVTYEVNRDKGYEPNYPAQETGELIESGKRASSIPFYWFGANDNDESIDPPPITAIADLNIEHYQLNAADVHQMWAGVTAQLHIDHGSHQQIQVSDENGKLISIVDYLNPEGIKVGVETAIHTINGGRVELIQQNADTPIRSKLEAIRGEARSIGAQMPGDVKNQTATAAAIEFGAVTSALITISDNISAALKSAIKHIAEAVSYNEIDQIKFSLNRNLITKSMDANEMREIRESVMQRVLPLYLAYQRLREGGVFSADVTFEEYKAYLEEDEGFFALAGVGTPQM